MRTTWKRVLGGLMAVAMVFALAACSQQGERQSPTAQSQEPQGQTSVAPQSPDAGQEPQETEDAQTSEPAGGGILVAYFSAKSTAILIQSVSRLRCLIFAYFTDFFIFFIHSTKDKSLR